MACVPYTALRRREAATEAPAIAPHESTTPSLLYAAIGAALLIGVGVLAARTGRVHVPHGA